MTDIAMGPDAAPRPKRARNWLDLSAKTWFVVTAIGQWLFVAYILALYGGRFVADGVDGLRGTHLPNGFMEGDDFGNAAVMFHVLFAALIIGAGQLQLIPAVRAKMPAFHRWSGRFYMVASVLVSMAGVYLVWARPRVIGSLAQDIGTTGSGVLILVFLPLALYYAIKRDIKRHRQWALRLFMVVSAVWFLRLMTFGWFMTTGGIGIDMETFSGPALYVIHFAQYLLPLAILEMYFWAQKAENRAHRGKVASVIFLGTAFMAAGILGVGAFSWIPRMGL